MINNLKIPWFIFKYNSIDLKDLFTYPIYTDIPSTL